MNSPVNSDRLIVHPMLQEVRGMCTDGASYWLIDAVLCQAVGRAKDLEAEVQRLRALIDSHPGAAAGTREYDWLARIHSALDEETR